MKLTAEEAALSEFEYLVRSRGEGASPLLEGAIFLEDVFGICLRDEEIIDDKLRGADAMRRLIAAKARP